MFAFDDKTRALLAGIARARSVSAAARALGLDPSDANRHLRLAEARAGARLVDRARGRRDAKLTRAGRARLAQGAGGALVGRSGEYASEDGTTRVRVGATRVLHVAGRVPPGPVALAIRPEDITVTRAPMPSSARNAWPARVARLEEAGEGTWRVELASGSARFAALVTRGARRDLRLREGSRVVALVKATAIVATSLA